MVREGRGRAPPWVRASSRPAPAARPVGVALIDEATLTAIEASLRSIPREHYAYLGLILALFAVQALMGRLARARARDRARADALGALPGLVEAMRAFGFDRYDLRWTRRGTAVSLTLYSGAVTLSAAGFGRTRAEAVLAALSVILENLPDDGPPQADASSEDDREPPNGDDGRRAEVPRAAATEWWRDALGLGPHATRGDADRAWRELAKGAHPDRGGSTARMAHINAARDEARRNLGMDGYASGSV